MESKLKVLVVGSGGREHAICWKIAQSRRLSRLYIAPGNAGTESLGENVMVAVEDHQALVGLARQKEIDLVLIGPEVYLAAGLADRLRDAGIHTFGPSKAAAQIEASKAFAKKFMARHNIPSGRFEVFDELKPALDYLGRVDFPVVVKASGLAAGKGVIVPDTVLQARAALRAMLEEGEFGEAGREVLIEERLSGPEVSLLAFSDGQVVRPMPPAQDHKRLLDGDRGPNTGGMGAYAPAPICPPELVEQAVGAILQPTVDGLRAEGMPFSGVLYAGLMLTPQGPQVLEFNCRFGDPETQVILPLLESDLLDIAEACAVGGLARQELVWNPQAAACVVLASENYPGKVTSGRVISGLGRKGRDSLVFHAGTRRQDDEIVTAGGRVLCVTGVGDNLPAALEAAYAGVRRLSFQGMQHRSDIGYQALEGRRLWKGQNGSSAGSAYRAAGVDIDAGSRAVDLMRAAVRSTYGKEVLAGIGAFGGLYDALALKNMAEPVLVASTDGVGTKVKLAAQAGRYPGIGQDIVNHCINDILVQGARPLFFLDYFAASRLTPEIVAEVVRGVAAACQAAGCALLGGETAEMPGVYLPDQFDVAGTIVGSVERSRILPRPNVQEGDVLLGLASSGPHTNGYSLIRKVFDGVALDTYFDEIGVPLAEALLAPHRSYFQSLWPLLQSSDPPIKALAHITGGGFVENIPRILPADLGAQVRLGSWPVPPLFHLIQQRGQVDPKEMYRVFNMGIGMVLVVSSERLAEAQRLLMEPSWIIGEVVSEAGKVALV
jgi:phosphoribosylamine--glycine ligase/phosphoribosylaminoimidazole synthetase